MSHTHDDRVADRPSYLCCAYGCPLIGSMSSSTSGSTDWWCALHYGKDASALQSITGAIRRVEWLALALTDMRKFPTLTFAQQGDEIKRLRQVFEQNGREDLFWKGRPETVRQWIGRVEPAFMDLVGVVLSKSSSRPKAEPDSWARAVANIPDFA